MPRSNRPRRRGGSGGDDEPVDLARALFGGRRVDAKRDGDWNVQPVSTRQAVKDYTCPGCTQPIAAGTEHLVAWKVDGLMGDAADLAARRHWHTHCWRIRA
jgi:hypothetical protein